MDTSQVVGSAALTPQRLVLLALAAGGFYVLALLVWPFLPALVTSTVLAALVYPAHRRLERRVGNRSVAAFLGTAAVFFLVLLPVLGLSVLLLDEVRWGITRVTQEAAGLLAPDSRFTTWLRAAAARIGLDESGFAAAVGQQAQAVANLLARRTLSFLSGLGGWLLQAGATLFTLYYLLRDGPALVGVVKRLIPLEEGQSDALVARAREVTFATVYGNVVVAIVQGALGGLAFRAVGVDGATLWGTVMGVLSLLPVLGPPLVWVPAGILLLAGGHVAQGITLLVIGTLIISTVDNLLRAILVSNRAQLHPLIAFFSVLGGLFLFGAVGIFVGPVLFVAALTVIEMARREMAPDRPAPVVAAARRGSGAPETAVPVERPGAQGDAGAEAASKG